MYPTGSATALRFFAWATPAEGVSLEALEKQLRALGNQVLEVDVQGNRIKVADVTQLL